jgi:hypothetical protein
MLQEISDRVLFVAPLKTVSLADQNRPTVFWANKNGRLKCGQSDAEGIADLGMHSLQSGQQGALTDKGF